MEDFRVRGMLSGVLVISTLFLGLVSVSGTPFAVDGRVLDSRHKMLRSNDAGDVQAQLFSAASVETSYILSDGDVVTCIPIENQPSVFHTNTNDIQLKPSKRPNSKTSSDDNKWTKKASQLFVKEFGGCPNGMIPVRRSRGGISTGSPVANVQSQSAGSQTHYVHQHAYTSTTISHPPSFKGTEVVLNVWQPFVEPRDFSLAQLWVMNTGLSYAPGSDDWALNTIEAGWQVYSELYGDKRPRLFVYWTGDGYVKTGCYNLNQDCPSGSPGFVQVSNKVLLGGSISPHSAMNATQYEIKLRVFKDDDSGNWWLQFNQEFVGYWPKSLFHSLKDESDLIQWGGEVFDVRESNDKTKTHMGSGSPAQSGFREAAYQRNLQFIDMDNKMKDVHELQAVATKPSCYTVFPENNQRWGTHFYYGGRC
ncbi:protein neprosin [Physcomitrium patens]|uniref:Neprosin PEP catalytic domain-containing protein n=1 Tax=Physcomitrium patens TaxID=3218 RepID=A0A2K1KJV7_PHYPA|nr:uncharacterized protein LOC112282233 isoform X1 [Physcomitrium patens]PNR54061.1 hypothetical protein PHYPA_007737 [Physcomitrium patens]|eukprot:XP_024375386.1 uncharacterized protein LOC112282233 isoform X1 [Physcomitrella patens]